MIEVECVGGPLDGQSLLFVAICVEITTAPTLLQAIFDEPTEVLGRYCYCDIHEVYEWHPDEGGQHEHGDPTLN